MSGNDWFEPGNWSHDVFDRFVPSIADDVVFANRGSNTQPVMLAGEASIAGLTWQYGRLGGGGTLNVHGVLRIGLEGANIEQRLDSGTTINVRGGATSFGGLRLDGSIGNATGSTFLVSTIGSGTGSFSGSGTFDNQGVFRVDTGAGRTAYFGSRFHNTGLVEVRSGELLLSGGGVQSGAFEVRAGSALNLNTTGINSPVGPPSLTFAMGTTIVNQGSLIGSGGNVMLAGAGITYSGNGAIMATGGRFTLALDGQLTPDLVRIQYNGRLDLHTATRAAALSFEQGTLGGTLDVSGLATFGADSAAFDQQTIAAGATLRLIGGAVQQSIQTNIEGTLINAAGSTFLVRGAVRQGTHYGSSIAGGGVFANAGLLVHDAGGARTNIFPTLNNSGSVIVRSGTLGLQGGGLHSGSFEIASGTTLQFGGGTHTLTSTSAIANAGKLVVSAGAVALEGASHSGAGTIDVQGGLLRTNQAFAAGSSLVRVSGGRLEVVGPLSMHSFEMTSGSTQVATGSAMTVAESYRQGWGIATIDGMLAAPNVLLMGGTFGGHGHIVGNLTNSGALLVPGGADAPGGTLSIDGDFNQSLFGTLMMVIGGPTPSLLSVDGTATLGGTLRLSFADGVVPVAGDRFTLMTYSQHSGRFVLDSSSLGNGYVVEAYYGADALTLGVLAVPEPSTILLIGVGLAVVIRRVGRGVQRSGWLAA